MGILWLWVLGALLFPALGNQVRRATRHIGTDAAASLQRLLTNGAMRPSAFLTACGHGLCCCARACCAVYNGSTADQAQATDAPPRARSGLLLAVLALLAYLGLSALLTVLHALSSDVTITSSAKLPAGLTVFAAYACGFALWEF